jgi:MarR family 2-MHQ and catechol resistance regulon transcriptional repressor
MVEGLTASQFSTLKVLRIHGALAQRDIAAHILKSGGNITMVVDNLEREGLVVRDRDTEDRRIVYVRLTEAGRELFDRIYPDHLERIRQSVGALSAEECDTLVALLEKVVPGQPPVECASAVLESSNDV